MSRVAKKPIVIPEKTEVNFDGHTFSVKGALGEISRVFRPDVAIEIANGSIEVKKARPEGFALLGTYASHIRNMIKGVNTGFTKKLIVEGIGFKSDVKGSEIVLSLGFSHPIKLAIPAGLKVLAEKNIITVSGIDNELVGKFASQVRSFKKPEPYKGKGIRYEDEVIRRKQGKKAA
jgi:large subunit ribosomal protein L6